MATPKKEEPKGGEARSGGKGKLILLIVFVLVLVLGAVGATLFFTGTLGKVLGHGAEGGGEHGAAPLAAAAPRPSGPAQYLAIDPPFVVSIDDQGQLRYVQISVSAMARDKKVLEAVTQNAPQIRNNLIMLYGRQSFATLGTPDGREKLRADTLDTIQKVLVREIGQTGIEEVYFTNFVMQ